MRLIFSFQVSQWAFQCERVWGVVCLCLYQGPRSHILYHCLGLLHDSICFSLAKYKQNVWFFCFLFFYICINESLLLAFKKLSIQLSLSPSRLFLSVWLWFLLLLFLLLLLWLWLLLCSVVYWSSRCKLLFCFLMNFCVGFVFCFFFFCMHVVCVVFIVVVYFVYLLLN